LIRINNNLLPFLFNNGVGPFDIDIPVNKVALKYLEIVLIRRGGYPLNLFQIVSSILCTYFIACIDFPGTKTYKKDVL